MTDNLKTATKTVNGLNHQTISSDTTTAGSAIDTTGYNHALVIFKSGAYSAGNATPLITESDDDSTYTAVPDDYLVGTEAAAALSAANTVATVGVIVTKKYLKVSAVTASSANLGVGATVTLSGARHLPTV
jgi:hypothetical protein